MVRRFFCGRGGGKLDFMYSNVKIDYLAKWTTLTPINPPFDLIFLARKRCLETADKLWFGIVDQYKHINDTETKVRNGLLISDADPVTKIQSP